MKPRDQDWKISYNRSGKSGGTPRSAGGQRTPTSPRIGARLRTRWFVSSHYVTQMVTGHGSFRDRLYNLGLVDDPRCVFPLGEMETPEHILYECTKYHSLRDKHNCGGCGLAAHDGYLDAEGVSPGFRGVRREGAQT